MAQDIKKSIRPLRNRSYLNRDFDSLRAELLKHAQTYFPDRIKDFSEASLGGLLLDFAAFVGDTNAFYLDHQFGELNIETAVETKNIERQLRLAGVTITGASPSVVDVDVFIEVPAETVSDGSIQPQATALLTILQTTTLKANNGTIFTLTEDVDFSETDDDGELTSEVIISEVDGSGNPSYYILKSPGTFISGTYATQSFQIPNTIVPFRTITLSKEDITDILSIIDSDGNEYYEVESLSQDTVFRGIVNADDDDELVKESLELLPAPRRFTRETSYQTGLTTIRFGSGRADTLDDDIIPDPSDLAIPLYGKNTFSRFSIDPGSLLDTQTLGISPTNTTITVDYRHGGGLSHNVAAESIRTVTSLKYKFPGSVVQSTAQSIRNSIDVKNSGPAEGGEDAPTLDELKDKVPSARNAQSRIVTREDLISRVYTMPSNFGRVFRTGIRSNPNNPLATQLYIISRDSQKNLVTSPDTLKKNLRTYLNQYRLISDAIDILDAEVLNISVSFHVAVDPAANKSVVVQSVISDLKSYFDIKNFQIDSPINLSEVRNIIINGRNVVSVIDLEIENKTGTINEVEYSESNFNVTANTIKGLVVGNPGSIFEVKYPDNDIVGSAS
jgi:hypothetical protein